jgi:hypothetical protein
MVDALTRVFPDTRDKEGAKPSAEAEAKPKDRVESLGKTPPTRVRPCEAETPFMRDTVVVPFPDEFSTLRAWPLLLSRE